jgi:hypothetical protein
VFDDGWMSDRELIDEDVEREVDELLDKLPYA